MNDYHALISAEALFAAADRARRDYVDALREAEEDAYGAEERLRAAVRELHEACNVAEDLARLVARARQVADDRPIVVYSTPDM